MKVTKLIIGAVVAASLLFVVSKNTSASEATFEVKSLTKENYRCFATSLLVSDYKILIGCSDLIYPAGGVYVLWATPSDGGRPIKLGTLDYGRKLFGMKKAFLDLFVTLEVKSRTVTPSEPIIMRGTAKPIKMLESSATPTPEKKVDSPDSETSEDQETEKEEPVEKETEKQLSVGEKLVAILKRAGVAALFAFIAIIGLIFVITRAK
jgi:hypothetical protein